MASSLDNPFGKNTITFHTEAIDFTLPNPTAVISWLQNVITLEKGQLSFLNFIFCNDSFLHQINIQYLDHDTLTDVITFPYSTTEIEGDIFISIDRVKENAELYKVSFEEELYRVMVHGTLHLLGYQDKTSEEKHIMRKNENKYLEIWNAHFEID